MGSKVKRIDEALDAMIQDIAIAKGLEYAEASRELAQSLAKGGLPQVGPKGAEELSAFGKTNSTPSDSMLRLGHIYQAQSLKPDDPNSRIALVERSDLTEVAWKKKLAERTDKRKQEMHEVDLKLKEKKLEQQGGSSKLKAGILYRCTVESCPVNMVGFASYEFLQAHYRENHPERFTTPQGREAGKEWGR